MGDERTPDLTEHFLLKQIGNEPENAVSLFGYVRLSDDGRRVTLYSQIERPNESAEFAAADVLASSEAPETVLPYHGTVVWVRRDTQVTYRYSDTRVTKAQLLPTTFTKAEPTLSSNARVGEVRRGRLRMRIPPSTDLPRECRGDCVSGCVCTSRCEVGCTS